MGWEAGVLGALIFAWVGVLGLVAIDLTLTARRVMYSTLALMLFAFAPGCTREKIVYRDNPAAPTVEPTPAPVPASLKFPQGVPEAEQIGIPGIPTLHDVVNQEIHAMFPLCAIGQERCDGLGYSPSSFFAVLAGRLRARGYWAGQDIEWVRDEISVARDCRGEWENFHAWYYGGYPIWAQPSNSPCSGEACIHRGSSYRGNWIIPASYCK